MDILDVGELVHQAAIGNRRWVEALQAIASFTGSARGQLIGLTTGKVDFNWVSGFPHEALLEFERMGGGDPARNFRVAAGGLYAPGSVVHEGHYSGIIDQMADQAYLDFCERYDIPFGAQTVLTHGDRGMIGLATLRSKADGQSRPEHLRAFAELIPRVRSAVELQWSIEGKGQALLLGSFDALDQAVLFLDIAGRICAATDAAERLLREISTPRLKDGRLLCDHPRDQTVLDRSIADILSGACADATVPLRRPTTMPIFVTVHGFRAEETNIGFRPRAIMVLRSPGHGDARINAWLRHAGLTQAEIEIAAALADGTDRQTIADERGARLGTVRQQIKTIFAKLGVHREAEFVALLAQARFR